MTIYVQLSQPLYTCQECGEQHVYGDDEFELHGASAVEERWIYIEVEQ